MPPKCISKGDVRCLSTIIVAYIFKKVNVYEGKLKIFIRLQTELRKGTAVRVDFFREIWYNKWRNCGNIRKGGQERERNYGHFTAGKGQNAVQYLFGRPFLLRIDLGNGGKKSFEGRQNCYGNRTCPNAVGKRKKYGVR